MNSNATRKLTIVVHGASGTQGSVVARRLLAGNHTVRSAVRNPASGRLPAGVDPVAADLQDEAALGRAYTGADAVVIHLPAGAGEEAVPQAQAVLAALKSAGVSRAVFNAGGAVWPEPVGVPFLDARTLLAAGLAGSVDQATVVGPAAAYMENLIEPWVTARLAATGELAQTTPAAVPIPWLALADLAEIIADVLETNDPPGRRVVAGPEALTGTETAAALSESLGRPIRWTTISFAEYSQMLVPHLGLQYAEALAALYGPSSTVPPPPSPPPGSLVQGHTFFRRWAGRQEWGV